MRGTRRRRCTRPWRQGGPRRPALPVATGDRPSAPDSISSTDKEEGWRNDLHWDASYKEAKHLGRYHGEQIFRALITATNELGEIRIQFHVVTDGHEQMVASIDAFLATQKGYGQPSVEILFSDKPAEDKSFFMEKIPSLKVKQDEFDAIAPRRTAAADGEMPTCRLEASHFKVLSKDAEMNPTATRSATSSRAARSRCPLVDCEWDVVKHTGDRRSRRWHCAAELSPTGQPAQA